MVYCVRPDGDIKWGADVYECEIEMLALAIVVGCSHPGVEKILEQATRIDSRLYTLTGGFHLVRTTEPEVRRVLAGKKIPHRHARSAAMPGRQAA